MREEELRSALKESLSGITFDPARRQAVLTDMKGEKPVRKKLSLAMALTAAVLLLAGGALAAGLGLFGQFAEEGKEPSGVQVSAETLRRLEENAVDCELQQTVLIGGREITVTIYQSYCDGRYIYYTYSLPKGYHMRTDHELINLTAENMAFVSVVDGETLLATSVSLPYRARDEWQRDGMTIGYEELLINKYVTVGETVDIRLSIEGRGGTGQAVFTLPVNSASMLMTGDEAFAAYHASVNLLISDVAAHGAVTIDRLDWARRHAFGEGEGDYVCAYQLIADGEVQENQLQSTTWHTGEYVLLLRFDCPPENASLSLRPVYAQAGPCPEEDIPLSPDRQ